MYYTIVPLISIAAPLISALAALENYMLSFALIFIAVMILIITISILNRWYHDQYQGGLSAVRDSRTYVRSIRGKRALALPLLMAIIRFIFRTTILYIPPYITKVIRDRLLELGLMLSIEGVAVSLTAYPSRPLSDRLGDINALAITRIMARITYSPLLH